MLWLISRLIIRLAILVSVSFVASPSLLVAQATQVRTMEVGGFLLTLGMTTESLTQGFGKTFKYEFNPSNSAFIFTNGDDTLAKIYVGRGRVVEIVKFINGAESSKAISVNAFKEFLEFRKVKTCAPIVDYEYPPNQELTTFRSSLYCGNVRFTTTLYFLSDKLARTDYELSVFSLPTR